MLMLITNIWLLKYLKKERKNYMKEVVLITGASGTLATCVSEYLAMTMKLDYYNNKNM